MAPSTRPRRPEQALHKVVAQFLRLALPPDAWFTTFPLGGGGNTRGAILSGLGTQRGTPDVLVVYEGHAHWLELKAPGGHLSAAQARCHVDLRAAGCRVAAIWSVEDAEFALKHWGVPLRASSGRVGERAA